MLFQRVGRTPGAIWNLAIGVVSLNLSALLLDSHLLRQSSVAERLPRLGLLPRLVEAFVARPVATTATG